MKEKGTQSLGKFAIKIALQLKFFRTFVTTSSISIQSMLGINQEPNQGPNTG